MILANLFQPGANLNMPLPDAGTSTNLKTGGLSLKEFIVHVFPRSFFEAMATNEILQILVFSLFFGFALTALKDKPAVTVTKFIDELAHAMLKLTEYVMLFAPMGVFGAVAAAITTQGIGILATYGKFIGTFYASLVVLWAVLIAAGFVFLGPRVFALMKSGARADADRVHHGEQRGCVPQAHGAARHASASTSASPHSCCRSATRSISTARWCTRRSRRCSSRRPTASRCRSASRSRCCS